MSNAIFDLEQQLLDCWRVTDDVDLVTKHFVDDPAWEGMDPKVSDTIMNKYFAIKELYDLKFQQQWSTFETVCTEYHQYRKAAERLKMTNKTYTANVQLDPENGEDYVLTFPDELLKEMGWGIGDTLVWEETTICEDHGEFPGFTLRKKDD
jgi:hypothetical protein